MIILITSEYSIVFQLKEMSLSISLNLARIITTPLYSSSKAFIEKALHKSSFLSSQRLCYINQYYSFFF